MGLTQTIHYVSMFTSKRVAEQGEVESPQPLPFPSDVLNYKEVSDQKKAEVALSQVTVDAQ